MNVVVGAAIVRHGRLLAQQRARPAHLANRWELPGGAVEPGESDTAALVRECLEELCVLVVPGVRVGTDVPLPGSVRVLRVYAASLADPSATPRAVEHRALRWITATDLDTLDWLEADRILLPALTRLLSP